MKKFYLGLFVLLIAVMPVSAQELVSYKIVMNPGEIVFTDKGEPKIWILQDSFKFEPEDGKIGDFYTWGNGMNFLLIKSDVAACRVIGYLSNVTSFVVAVPSQKVHFSKSELDDLAFDYIVPYVRNSKLFKECASSSEKEAYLINLMKNEEGSLFKQKMYRRIRLETGKKLSKLFPFKCIGYNPVSEVALFDPPCDLESVRDFFLDNYILKESEGKYVRENCEQDSALVKRLRQKFLKALYGE